MDRNAGNAAGLSPQKWRTPALGALIVLTGLAYVFAYFHHPQVRHHPSMPDWWIWTDQGRYLRAAQAWAVGNLDPAQHWYPAGYPLLGAAFVWLMPGQPFYVVDLVCLLATGVLTVALGARLAPESRWAGPIAALSFVLVVLLDPLALRSFVEPWTTTPTAPLTLSALLLTLRLWDRPSVGCAVAIGAVVGAIGVCRPVDMVPLLLAIGPSSMVALRGLTLGRRTGLVAAAMVGTAGPAAVGVGAHLAVFGLARGNYLAGSAATGFEWRLLPFRWVTIMISAAPDLPDAIGLTQAFPVIVTGMIGMIGCLIVTGGRVRLQHAMTIGAVWLHIVLFLCYRDLHAQGLFRFQNYHYFKWSLPVFGLYTWFLVGVVARSRRRWLAWSMGAALAGASLCWRVRWQPGPEEPVAIAGQTLTMAAAPHAIGTGLFVTASGSFESVYLADQHLQFGERVFDSNQDFKLLPLDDGFVLTPLRPLPTGPAALRVDDGVHLLGPVRPVQAAYALSWPPVPLIIEKLGRLWSRATGRH